MYPINLSWIDYGKQQIIYHHIIFFMSYYVMFGLFTKYVQKVQTKMSLSIRTYTWTKRVFKTHCLNFNTSCFKFLKTNVKKWKIQSFIYKHLSFILKTKCKVYILRKRNTTFVVIVALYLKDDFKPGTKIWGDKYNFWSSTWAKCVIYVNPSVFCKWQSIPIFLDNPHRQRSLAGYRP